VNRVCRARMSASSTSEGYQEEQGLDTVFGKSSRASHHSL
jgi:hypothetical protein